MNKEETMQSFSKIFVTAALALAAAAAFAENNNDMSRDINATSLGTRMRNVGSMTSAPLSSSQTQDRLPSDINNPEDESYGSSWSESEETERAAALEGTNSDMSRKIRQEFDNRNLSDAAKNVRIMNDRDGVTLSGEVPSDSDKEAINDAAEAAVGEGKVFDELHVRE